MKYINLKSIIFFAAFISIAIFTSCSKSSPTPITPSDPCAGKIIVVSASTVASTGCTNNGSLVASATGSTGFSFKLNTAGAYQTSGVFNNVAPGTYTVFAKDAAGCEQSSSVTVAAGAKGPLFTSVRNLVTSKCQSCHNNSIQNGGMNWESDCSIVSNQARIKVRAVDLGDMPLGGPVLSASEKAAITNWINAGGKLTD